ncbi:hypothetical protein [Peptostreptococcus equinus]|uniref:Lipoprotein n=1 Tax=Peptostreptococcus equinus TaxID=3003601 RepID=A0ABY7JPU2_9FIRM|nr:hypothetical protein [Peptostreptococcus sp. CBA3647]WAW15385.1 hypothetical protein O0R46_02770 [Peptostreptococcus sp. CBA3647]
MKKKLIASVLLVSFILSGCGQKAAQKTNVDKNNNTWLKTSIENINKESDRQSIQETTIKFKDGKIAKQKYEYTISKDKNLVKIKSADPNDDKNKLEIFYKLNDEKIDVYVVKPGQEKAELENNAPLNKELIDGVINSTMMDENIDKYEIKGEEKKDGKDVIKVVYHRSNDNSLSEELKKAGVLKDDLINKHQDLKEAIENDKKKNIDLYYYFDKKSKELLYSEFDSTSFTIINHYSNGENSNPPIKSTTKTLIKTKNIEKIVLPTVIKSNENTGEAKSQGSSTDNSVNKVNGEENNIQK